MHSKTYLIIEHKFNGSSNQLKTDEPDGYGT